MWCWLVIKHAIHQKMHLRGQEEDDEGDGWMKRESQIDFDLE